jgi:hypothetical protein
MRGGSARHKRAAEILHVDFVGGNPARRIRRGCHAHGNNFMNTKSISACENNSFEAPISDQARFGGLKILAGSEAGAPVERLRVAWISRGFAVAIAVGLLLVGGLAARAQTIAAGTNDVATLRKMLASVEAWDARGKTQFDPALAASLDAQWRSMGDPFLRIQARELVPTLERAAVARPRVAAAVEAVKAAKGAARFEKGGPQWLRDLVGDDAVRVLDRLTAIDVYDRQNPHDKTYRRNETLVDDWLENLAGLPDLVALDLANTNVKGPGLKVVGTLRSLERLNLTLTLVTDPYLENLSGLTKLRILSMASSKSTGEGFRFLGGIPHLENANFHTTPANDAGLAGIAHVTSLERLEIVHTKFTDAGTPALAKLVNLERLQLGSRDATGATVAHLTGLKKLRELDLHDGQASIEGVRHAGKIASLRVLRIFGVIKDEGAQHLANLKNLELLVAPGTGITDAGLEHLAALKNLKRIEINGCKVSDAAVARLKASIPGVDVVK